ncbi:uncharacterized protein LOC143192870 isoform X2 [Rhynchophorus ferrugineus]|uniref:E3 ubiquitin-protein ligase CHFR n=1 Tax=Rhynchophorus ferrugineus TaxID=354439 RepID=A0A834MNJ7_RHYFE|nr:hypothetical protein GWI33_005989 [Rhynchophorus ferrugineus]
MIFPILKNVSTGNIIEITDSPFTIGRSLNSNYVIEDKIISRTHCLFNKKDNHWILQDSSTNGIFLNDDYYHLQGTPALKHNDKISLGTGIYTYQFLLCMEDPPKKKLNGDIISVADVQVNISDELLSELADNMLKNIEKTEKEPEVAPTKNIKDLTSTDSNVCFPNVTGSSNKCIFDAKKYNNEKQSVISPYNPSKRLKILTDNEKSSLYTLSNNENGPVSHERPSTSSKDLINTEMGDPPVISNSTDTEINSDKENTNFNRDQNNSEHNSNQNTQLQISDPSAIKQNQFEEMEDELLCTICANLFIKPITLACSHSFCQYCIDTWKQKKSECPICRKKITSSARTLVLDNIIEKMLENASQELRDQRKMMQQERKNLEDKEKSKQVQKRNKSQRAVMHNITMPLVIQIDTSESSISDSSRYSSSDSDFDDGLNISVNLPETYYGGYGRCYSCGEEGHWANGCPYR